MLERMTGESEPQPRAPHKPSTSEISRVMSVMGRKGGKIGGKRSLVTLTDDERRERALKAAKARWANRKK